MDSMLSTPPSMCNSSKRQTSWIECVMGYTIMAFKTTLAREKYVSNGVYNNGL